MLITNQPGIGRPSYVLLLSPSAERLQKENFFFVVPPHFGCCYCFQYGDSFLVTDEALHKKERFLVQEDDLALVDEDGHFNKNLFQNSNIRILSSPTNKN